MTHFDSYINLPKAQPPEPGHLCYVFSRFSYYLFSMLILKFLPKTDIVRHIVVCLDSIDLIPLKAIYEVVNI